MHALNLAGVHYSLIGLPKHDRGIFPPFNYSAPPIYYIAFSIKVIEAGESKNPSLTFTLEEEKFDHKMPRAIFSN